ncbi:MAG: ATP-binding protein, partial [Enterovibrio sp.]
MLLLGISLSGYFIHKRQFELENQLSFLGTAIIKPVAMAGGQALVNQDREPLRNLISELHNQQSNIVRSISIFTAEHELFVTSNHYVNLDTLPQPMPNLPLTEPLATQRLQDKIILQGPIFTTTPFNEQLSHPPISGYVTIELETTPNNLQFYQEITFASLMLLICFGIAAFFIYRLFQDLERPLKAIGETIDSIRQGHLDVRLENQPLGEFNHLKDGINAMAQALAEYHFELQQSFEQATSDLRETLEQLEVQNVELDLAKKNAQAATRIKSEFIANMSHELRTPLNSIIGFTRQVLKTPLSQNQQDYLSTIERSANNLLKIINDILDFSKLEAGKLLIESITFDIEQIMDELMEQLAPMAHEKKLDLVLMLEPNIPRHLIGDPQRIQQIITNLVSNATKFTDTGMVQVKVVMLSQTPNTLTLQFIVQDPGIGIGEEQQSKLFEAFGQADASISRRYGGTGLGLVITKKLVQELRGKIGFSSTPQVGSTFWFSLTLEPSFDKRKTPTPQNAKLLLLNDDQMSAQALSDRLSYHGFDVTCCTSLTPNYASVDAVILYQNTKSETQFAQLSQQVTQAKALCSKVIVCLPSTEIILSEKLISIGASACLMTPVNLQKLLAYLQLPQFKPTPSCPPMLPPTPHVPAIALEKRVLAVDDNHANLKLLNMLLQNHD